MIYDILKFTFRSKRIINTHLKTPYKITYLKRLCINIRVFEKYLQIQWLNNIAEEFKLSITMLEGFVEGNEKKQRLTPSEELAEYLSTFNIMQNEITGALSITDSHSKKYTVDELKLHVEELGFKGARTLNILLDYNNSNKTVINMYNPLTELFKQLAKEWHETDRRDHLSELLNCIPAYDHKDQAELNYYEKRKDYYITKFLKKCVMQSFQCTTNDAMLLLGEPDGGSGKSYILEWLFSLPQLKQYHHKIQEVESYINFKELTSAKFSINWDELPLTLTRYNAYKSYIASTEGGGGYNKKKKTYIESTNRFVNWLGSSNHMNRKQRNGFKQPGFLLTNDAAMLRRFIVIEINTDIYFDNNNNATTIGIDYKRYLNIPLNLLWGQIAYLAMKDIKENNQTALTYECDHEELRNQNKRYLNTKDEDNQAEIIKHIFKPADIEAGELLTTREILNELEKMEIKTNFSTKSLGKFFSNSNYIHGRKRDKFGYPAWWVNRAN